MEKLMDLIIGTMESCSVDQLFDHCETLKKEYTEKAKQRALKYTPQTWSHDIDPSINKCAKLLTVMRNELFEKCFIVDVVEKETLEGTQLESYVNYVNSRISQHQNVIDKSNKICGDVLKEEIIWNSDIEKYYNSKGILFEFSKVILLNVFKECIGVDEQIARSYFEAFLHHIFHIRIILDRYQTYYKDLPLTNSKPMQCIEFFRKKILDYGENNSQRVIEELIITCKDRNTMREYIKMCTCDGKFITDPKAIKGAITKDPLGGPYNVIAFCIYGSNTYLSARIIDEDHSEIRFADA